MVTVINRIAEHVGAEQGADPGFDPPLVELRYSVDGKCDFHVARVRKGVYQVRVGKSDDAVLNFRSYPDYLEDIGQPKAWRRLRAMLRREFGKDVKFNLENLECDHEAWRLAERVGSAINAWRLGTGRSDFPSAALVAQAIELPEPMVRVALRDYVRDAG